MVFQMKVDKIKKDAKNPFFKSKYATLSNILDSIQTPMEESGLSFAQFPDENHSLTTIIIHAESGEWMQATYKTAPVPEYNKEKDAAGSVVYRGESYVSPQSVGSAITYARRYALAAILGLNIDDDDDANMATHGRTTPVQAEDNAKQWLNENTSAFTGAVEKLRAGATTMEKIKAHFRVSKAIETKLLTLSTAQHAN